MQNLIGKYVENRVKLQGGIDSVASEEKVCYIVQVNGNPSVATRGTAGPGGSDTQPGLEHYRTMTTPPGQTRVAFVVLGRKHIYRLDLSQKGVKYVQLSQAYLLHSTPI